MIPHPSPTKRIYVAGPMQGIPEFNFPRFNAVTACFRSGGHEVFNPAEKDTERHGTNIGAGNMTGDIKEAIAKHGFSLRQALSEDCDFICLTANCIVLLPGWEKSNGAMAEHRLAVALQNEGMEIIYLTPEICEAMEAAHQRDLASREVANAA